MHKFFLFLFLMSCNKFTSWQTPKGGDFVLKTPSGEINTANLRGKTIFVFFGFLHCPHVCPTTIKEINRMMKALPPEDREKFVPIFVSVDPERDTLPVLKDRFSKLDPSFIPATGSEEEVRKALKLFGGDFKIMKGKLPEDIFVDHTSSIFVINRKGVWVNSLPFDSNAIVLRDAINMASLQKPYWSDEARDARIEVLGENEKCDLGSGPCHYNSGKGDYTVELFPRPINHLEKIRITVRSKDNKLDPKVADLSGVELAMGLIRPKLVKTIDSEWIGSFTLPTCELKTMNWKLRLLLLDQEKNNFELKYRFISINDKWTSSKE